MSSRVANNDKWIENYSDRGTCRNHVAHNSYVDNKLQMRMQRKKELRIKIGTFIFTLGLVIFFSVSYCAIASKANMNLDNIEYKYYTSIEVAFGESLWSIADTYAGQKYDTKQQYIDEVVKINSLKGEDIFAGQNLIIPYHSSEYLNGDI